MDQRVAIVRAARELGFAAVGIAPATILHRDAEALARWLAAGMHGEMAYLAERPARADPVALEAWARSVIVVALAYDPDPGPASLWHGRIARYARGADYHGVAVAKLRLLGERCAVIAGRPVKARVCVDTAPLLERALAARAGVGFIGKNGLLIRPGQGSYLLLGELLVDIELGPDTPLEVDCGDCTACLEACPTGALTAPFIMDARRCISYLTIEMRGALLRELRAHMGRAICGCDICQAVCPHNQNAGAPAPELRARLPAPALDGLLSLGSAGHKRLVKGTALSRLSRNQLARNAAVALGNTAEPRAVGPLARALARHPSALVRGHAAWALGELGSEAARCALDAATVDPDPFVAEEVAAAQGRLSTLAVKRVKYS